MTIKVFSVAEMVAAEKAADAAGHSYVRMMETAGRRVAEAILQRHDVEGRQLLVLVGPGNNGGDGLVADGAGRRRVGRATGRHGQRSGKPD